MQKRAILATLSLIGLGVRQDRPTLVSPGVISTAAPEFALTISPDGTELYFNRASSDRKQLVIMTSRWVNGQWAAPTVAPFSGRDLDVDPFITPDGRRLYFSSTRPRAGSTRSDFNTWYLERSGAGWSEPIDPGPPLNSDSTDVFVSLSRDGTIAFSSNRSGPSRIHLARNLGGTWSEPAPVRLGRLEAGGNPLLGPDGRFMIFVAAGPDDRADLFASCRRDTGWSDPIPLPGVNSRWADFAPAFRPPATLYFTSERPGIVPAGPDSVRPPGDLYSVDIPISRLCP